MTVSKAASECLGRAHGYSWPPTRGTGSSLTSNDAAVGADERLSQPSPHVDVVGEDSPPDRELPATDGDAHDQFANLDRVVAQQSRPSIARHLPMLAADAASADPPWWALLPAFPGYDRDQSSAIVA